MLDHGRYVRHVRPGEKRLGLTTKDEQAWCTWFGAEAYGGHGKIVELGCWLGSLTTSYCEGLLANPRARGRGVVAYAYDLFRWEEWCESEVRGTAHAGRIPIGGSFEAYVRELHAAYAHLLEVRQADLSASTWGSLPIELLLNDAAKTPAIARNVFRNFAPALIPGLALAAHQDYLWPTDSFLAVFVYLTRSAFVHEYTVPDSCMAVFRCVSRWTRRRSRVCRTRSPTSTATSSTTRSPGAVRTSQRSRSR